MCLLNLIKQFTFKENLRVHHHHHYHHEVWTVRHSACSLALRVKLAFQSFLRTSCFFSPLAYTYFSACLSIRFMSIRSKYCSHFCWYSRISRTVFCTPIFSRTDLFLSRPNLIIPNKWLKNCFFCCFQSLLLPFLQHPGFTTTFKGLFIYNVVDS